MRIVRRLPGRGIGAGLISGGRWLLRRRSAGLMVSPAGAELVDETSADLPVLDYGSIVERTDSAALIELLRIKLGLPREVFDSAVRPVIVAFAQYVQLLPAEASSQTTSNFLFEGTLIAVLRALDHRRGKILPRGAPPEVIGAQTHRWTYAVFIATLLCDIDGAMNGLAVTISCRDGSCAHWTPTAGDMHASGALRYRVECAEQTASAARSRGSLALLLLDRMVPPSVLAWLAAEPEPMGEVRRFLQGDEAARSGAIASIVMRARRGSGASTSNDLGSALDSPSGAPTPEAWVESGNVDQGRGEALVSTEPRSEEAPGYGLDASLDSPVSESVPETSRSTHVIVQDPPADSSRSEAPEYLEDFGGEYGSSLVLRDGGDTAGAADTAGAIGQRCPKEPATPRPNGPTAEADRFMEWLQAGLADGSLPVNAPGAVVHFVPEGMLLVSPRVFREYAMRVGEGSRRVGQAPCPGKTDAGKAIQLQVLRAGWHVRGPKGINMLSYRIMRADGSEARLSGVVIRDPERFVTPVPPVNPLLVRLLSDASDP